MGTNIRQRSDGGMDFVSDSTGNIVSSMGVGGNAISARSAQGSIVAHAGGGQSLATALTAGINQVSTVASAADSVKLPASAAGLSLVVINSSANAMQVFGISPDTINAVATGTGVSVPAGKTAEFFCAVAGSWFMNLSA